MSALARVAAGVVLAGIALLPLGVVLGRDHGPSSETPTRGELERGADAYRDSAGRQCGLDPLSLAMQDVRDGEITWTSLQDGRRVGFTFSGRDGQVFCGR